MISKASMPRFISLIEFLGSLIRASVAGAGAGLVILGVACVAGLLGWGHAPDFIADGIGMWFFATSGAFLAAMATLTAKSPF